MVLLFKPNNKGNYDENFNIHAGHKYPGYIDLRDLLGLVLDWYFRMTHTLFFLTVLILGQMLVELI